MEQETEILLKFCENEWAQERLLENQRSTLTNFIIFISVADFGLIIQKGFDENSIPLAIILIIIGLYGALVSAKLYERWKFSVHRVREWRGKIDKLYPEAQLIELKNLADKKHSNKFPIFSKIHLTSLWIILHLSIAFLGVVCLLVIIF